MPHLPLDTIQSFRAAEVAQFDESRGKQGNRRDDDGRRQGNFTVRDPEIGVYPMQCCSYYYAANSQEKAHRK
ncbi:MAG TPA: hypothetical protein VLW06_01715 [Terriglobales bacterium]|nr:hypothetical protein [Terriglobales bacterium]